MKTKIFTKARGLMMLILATIISTNVWGVDPTITINKAALTNLGSGYENGAVKTDDIDNVTFKYSYLMYTGGNIQAQASNGNIYNYSLVPGKITQVAITHTGAGRSTTIAMGTSTSSYTVGSSTGNGSISLNAPANTCPGYFKITRGGNAAQWTRIVITYTPATITPSETEITGLDYNVGGGPSEAQSFTITGSNIPANLKIKAPTNFQVKVGSGSWGSEATMTITLTGSATAGTPTAGPNSTVYVRLAAGKSAGEYSGNVSIEMVGCNTITGVNPKTVAVSGTVSAGSVAVTGVTVDPTSKSIVPGQTFDITPTISPSNATDKVVSWTSSPTTYATVSNGTVTGVAAGSSTITCTTHDGGYTATCAVTVCAVTMQARDEDGNAIAGGGPGAPTRSGASIAPAADAGNYVFKEWQITNASLGSSASTKSNTITNPTGAVTVTAVYYKPITITYKANNQVFTTQTYSYGGTLAFPVSNPTPGTYSCDGKTFVGWVGEANKDYSHASIAPTYATAGGSVTAAATYYAVFATAGAGGATTYTKVTTISAGTYLMATETSAQYTAIGTAAYTGDDGSGKRGSSVSVSISTGVISTKPATALEITVTLGTGDDAGYFAMYDGSKYITQGAKNEFAFVDDISYQWDLNASGQIHQKGTFNNSDDNRIYFDNGNSGSSPNLFKPMTSRSEGNNNSSYYYHAYLFKKSGGVTYSDYTTSCVCTAPEYVTISGAWDKFGGETISLTATPYDDGDNEITTGITGWKWQKLVSSTWTDIENGTSDGVTTSGATSQNLQISNCKVNNSGKYRCVVSTGATCSTASATATDGSQGHLVRVYALECYTGGTTVYNFTRDGDNQRGSVEITLSASTAYTFKVHADNDYYGNNGTVNEDVTNWVMCNNSTTACTTNLTVNSGLGGTFTFTMDYSTSGSSSVEGEPELSITYPRKTIYLTPGVWNSESAKFAFYYFRKEGGTIYGEGFTDFITPSDCGSSAEIPQWNGVKINAVRLNSSTTASDLTNSANHYKAAWDKKWNQTSDITVTSNNSVTITDWGSGDSPYTYGTFSTPTYTISYDAGTSGSGSKSNESKTCGVDFTLPNTQVFTRNGYTMDGWATEDGGAKVYNLGGSYTTNAAQTFYPHWALASYGVTLNTNGGTINAGNVTTYTYGTGATLPTDVTKSHATFQGWYAASNFSGDRVYTIGTTEYGDKEYWAKWETITWTVTWKVKGETVRTDASVTDGDKVASLPSDPSDLTTGSDGCDAEFVGWVIEANDPGALSISTRDTAPSGLFTNVAGSPAITANTTFVAIYRQEQ